MSLLNNQPMTNKLSLRVLFLSFVNKSLSDEKLTEGWRDVGDTSYLFSKSRWSLLAIILLRISVFKKKSIKICVPAYICKSVIENIKNNKNIEIFYYNIDKNLDPDLLNINSIVSTNKIDLLLIVNYFGNSQNLSFNINELISPYDIWIIEDCTHQLLPKLSELNSHFVMYSPYKFLSIADGAILVVKKKLNLEYININQTLKQIHHNLVNSVSIFYFKDFVWLLKKIFQYFGINNKLGLPYDEILFKNKIIHSRPGISYLSKKIFSILVNKLVDIEHGKMSKIILLDLILKIYKFEPQNHHKNPYLARYHFNDKKYYHALIKQLSICNVPFLSWPDLPTNYDSNFSNNFNNAENLKSSMIFLPIHDSIKIHSLISNIIYYKVKNWSIIKVDDDCEWNSIYKNLRDINLIQSNEYCASQNNFFKKNRYILRDENSKAVSAFNTLSINFFFFKIVRLNRGPLIFNNIKNNDERILKILSIAAFIRHGLNKFSYFSISPNVDDFKDSHEIFLALGLKVQLNTAWCSGILDLSKDISDLHYDLHKNWKNALSKSNKVGVNVTKLDNNETNVANLISAYEKFVVNKNFLGLNRVLLRNLSKHNNNINWSFNIFVATIGMQSIPPDVDSALGYVVTVHTGKIATYLLGFTTLDGRYFQANTALLWHAINYSKTNGIDWFDIGGLDKNTPDGIKKFKKGLNPHIYKLVENYRFIKIF